MLLGRHVGKNFLQLGRRKHHGDEVLATIVAVVGDGGPGRPVVPRRNNGVVAVTRIDSHHVQIPSRESECLATVTGDQSTGRGGVVSHRARDHVAASRCAVVIDRNAKGLVGCRVARRIPRDVVAVDECVDVGDHGRGRSQAVPDPLTDTPPPPTALRASPATPVAIVTVTVAACESSSWKLNPLTNATAPVLVCDE